MSRLHYRLIDGKWKYRDEEGNWYEYQRVCNAMSDAHPTYWPGQSDHEEIGPIGDGTPHARMQWFWAHMEKHEQLISELTGWSPFSSSYRFEAAIADAFDKLAEERKQ